MNGTNNAGWNTRYEIEIDGAQQQSTTAILFVRGELINQGKTLKCVYESLTTMEHSFTARMKMHTAYLGGEGVGFALTRSAPGVCTIQSPAEWDSQGECIGTTSQQTHPLCPSPENFFYNGDCSVGTTARCTVVCPALSGVD